MIFEQMTLKNFRQFAGTHTIRFASDRRRNVTVLHGFNGSGKTALLNAFTWVLYDDFSPDFEASDRLENEAALAVLDPGDQLKTSVELIFRDGDRKYTAERTIEVEKDENGTRRVVSPASATLFFVNETGEQQSSRNPDETLLRLLPKRLHPFFFFNGERIERLARSDAYQQIAQGVRTLLDIELFERAVTHMNGDLSRRLRQEIASHSGDEGEQARKRRDELDEEKVSEEAEIEQIQKNLDSLDAERERIDDKLASMAGLAALLAQRGEAEKREVTIKTNLRDRRDELAREFSDNGYLWFAADVLASAKKMLDRARQKGELPAPIKRQFVEDLLSNEKCICGRDLSPGSPEYATVDDWRQHTHSDELENVVNKMSSETRTLETRMERSFDEIDRLQEKRDSMRTELSQLEEELSELSNKIGDREHGEDPERLERRRRQIDDDKSAFRLKFQKAHEDIERLDEEIAEVDRAIRNLERADEQGKLAQRRLDAVANVVTALSRIRQLRHDELRDDLSEQLAEVWGRIAIKDYKARLDDDFRLLLTKDLGDEEVPVRGASTGEKQVLSLAFVGALGAKAQETFDKSKEGQTIFRGGLYPLVIDSAFGSLETEYRREVARWIPTLAPQVIIMVSESQWRREVEEELLPRIGTEWVLKLETTKNRSRTIDLRGTDYHYVIESDDGFERTTIVEVEVD